MTRTFIALLMHFADNHNSTLNQIFIVITTLTLAHLGRQSKHAFSPKKNLTRLTTSTTHCPKIHQ